MARRERWVADERAVGRMVVRLAGQIARRNRGVEGLAFVGIKRRGVPLAERLAAIVNRARAKRAPVGAIDITLYRDDLQLVAETPIVRGSEIGFDINGRTIILVDDVLFTARTVRAALSEMLDYGRPRSVQLAVLVDRGGRELPIQADFCGLVLKTRPGDIVDVFLKEQDAKEGVTLTPTPRGKGEEVVPLPVNPAVGRGPATRMRHLLGIEDLTRRDITGILDQARTFRGVLDRPIPVVPALRGRTICNLFFEASTRTATSFQLAASRLSAQCVNFSKATSAVSKGESLLDTARNIESMRVEGIVIRHPSPGAPHFLARHCKAFVVNAGDGAHEHPTQALLDSFTLRERLGTLDKKRVLIVGDISHSRVARSNILAFTKLGAKVAVCGPPTLVPPWCEELGCEVFYRLDRVLFEVDVVNMLRVQLERISNSSFPSVREYRDLYGLTGERLRRLGRDVIVTHPGPVNWGVEMDFDVAEFERSVILDQVTNGVAVRMAVLYLLAGGEAAE